jgi:adenylate cyclase
VKPDDHQSMTLLAFAMKTVGSPAEIEATRLETLERARRHVALNPDDARGVYVLAQSLAELGQSTESLVWAQKMVALAPDDPYILYGMVCILTRIGRLDEAVRYFEQAVERGFVQKEWIEHDHDLDPIRDHPAYRAIVARL